MGRRYAPSSLFYGWSKDVSRETFLLRFLAFFRVFCIGGSNSGVQNTAQMPVFCSINIAAWISL